MRAKLLRKFLVILVIASEILQQQVPSICRSESLGIAKNFSGNLDLAESTSLDLKCKSSHPKLKSAIYIRVNDGPPNAVDRGLIMHSSTGSFSLFVTKDQTTLISSVNLEVVGIPVSVG